MERHIKIPLCYNEKTVSSLLPHIYSPISIIAQDAQADKSIISGGYKFFDAEANGRSTLGRFLDYHRLMFFGLPNLSVQPYWG